MMALDLSTIVRATDGKVFASFETQFSGIGTDTRADLSGQLFIALKGDSFDAHDYLEMAVSQGAKALLVHRFPEVLNSLRAKVTIIVVKDTLLALQSLAQFRRRTSKASVLAITGSNGKTTSKEFAAAVIGSKLKVHYSKGSFNNHWGLPFSLLSMPLESQVGILEMGMNHAGEIKRLCEIAEPDIVVCTSVGRAHIEHFGSVEAIAAAKEEIYEFAPPAARRIYNLDSPWTQKMFLKARKSFPKADRILSFSQINSKADVHFQIEEMSMQELSLKGRILNREGRVKVPVFGQQNLTNLMVAAASALAVGIEENDIWPALANCRTNWGRNQLIHSELGGEILFDGYNANPDSVEALLMNLPLLTAGTKLGVFAEMLELGEAAAQAHRELGEKAAQAGLQTIWFYGPHHQEFAEGVKKNGFAGTLIHTFDFEDAQAEKVAAQLLKGAVAVVKGSRGMKLERFVLACQPIDFSIKNKT